MTDINVDEVVAALGRAADAAERYSFCTPACSSEDHEHAPGLYRMSHDALVQVRGSADEWWKQYDAERVQREMADAYRAEVERERDEALAVIERAEDYITRHYFDTQMGTDVLTILVAAPADALRERDAEKWDEGAEMGHRLYAEPLHIAQRRNPYREETTRG